MKSIFKIASLFIALLALEFLVYKINTNFIFSIIYFTIIILILYVTKKRNTIKIIFEVWYILWISIFLIYILWSLLKGFNLVNFILGVTLGIKQILFLINSIFTIELILTFITVSDIIGLPIDIKYKRHFLLGRTLYLDAITRFENTEILINTIPDFQIKHSNRLKNIKIQFMKKIIWILIFSIYLLKQSEALGALIDNRINHNFKNTL